MTKQVQVTVSGCDDETTVLLNVDEQGLNALRALSVLSGIKSEYGCMPTVYVDAAP